ncbi:MAG: response regulator [Sumerlaeia bacterium]
MPGERVLVVDRSSTVQEATKAILEEHGYRVTIASNGLATVTHPEIERFDLIMCDSTLDGIDGLETTRQIKTDKEIYKIPVLLMIPEDSIDLLESVPLKGATGWMAKPFTPTRLLTKVEEIIDEQRLRVRSRKYLDDAADRQMQQLAETKIQAAVEKKIQIIVERAIQSIVSIIDQKARREVDARVTALTAEKEQELVRITVQEVAKSMIEKQAERKVTEAMQTILVEQTEKTVRRAADSMLPSMVKDRIKGSLEDILPREVEARVDKAAQLKAEEIGEGIVQIVQQQAIKHVPLVAKEKLPELAERQLVTLTETKMPRVIAESARAAVAKEMAQTVKPIIDEEIGRLKRARRTNLIIVILVLLVTLVVGILAPIVVDQTGILSSRSPAPVTQPTAPAAQ